MDTNEHGIPPLSQPASPQVDKLQRQVNACEDRLKKVAARLDEAREKARSVSEEAGAHPEAVVQRHIKLLHQYNEIRDIGLGLLGMIAETRGDRLVDVQQQFGVTERD